MGDNQRFPHINLAKPLQTLSLGVTDDGIRHEHSPRHPKTVLVYKHTWYPCNPAPGTVHRDVVKLPDQ
jgi:hypothetical protein